MLHQKPFQLLVTNQAERTMILAPLLKGLGKGAFLLRKVQCHPSPYVPLGQHD